MLRLSAAILLMFTLLAAGCGQKGDLYLPDDESTPGEPSGQE